ncbi:MAG: OsmC family protein [Gammaproteobacteria bacterium]|nr:MAG: OsmC family protein [Gammaproteobacteria bacterium]
MQVRIKWLEQRSFQAETGSGHTLTMDGPPEHGGQNIAARPMEMILVGLGGCSAFDVVEILEKSRQIVNDCQIEIDAERADEIPAVFTKIHMHFIIAGDELNEKHVKRAVELSVDKYCSVVKMMRPNVNITFDHEIR